MATAKKTASKKAPAATAKAAASAKAPAPISQTTKTPAAPTVSAKSPAQNMQSVRPAAQPVQAAKVPAPPPTRAPQKLPSSGQPTLEQHYKLIETAAYFIAERDHFKGDPVQYWLQAEKQVAAQLAKK